MLIAIDERDPRPIYLQIVAEIKRGIRAGQIREGEELPGVRELAGDLGVNLHTVHQAYRELARQGVVHLRLGRRARVAPVRRRPAARAEIEAALLPRLEELMTDAFHLGLSPDEFRALVDDLAKKHRTEEGQK
jgi:GntR family transcriptional regulator